MPVLSSYFCSGPNAMAVMKKFRLFINVISAQRHFMDIGRAAESSVTTLAKLCLMRWERLKMWKVFQTLTEVTLRVNDEEVRML
jgi:hypothetical protein